MERVNLTRVRLTPGRRPQRCTVVFSLTPHALAGAVDHERILTHSLFLHVSLWDSQSTIFGRIRIL